jgi:hypothetical protein
MGDFGAASAPRKSTDGSCSALPVQCISEHHAAGASQPPRSLVSPAGHNLTKNRQQLWRGYLGNGALALLLPHPLAAPLLVLAAPRLAGRGGRGEYDNLLDGKRRAGHEISN